MAYFEINNLKVYHHTFEGKKTVLDIDALTIEKGSTYGIVGESGSGKTVLALSILGLLQCPPGEITKGEILLDSENLLNLKDKEMQQRIRGKKVSMIFQDPMSTLNPVYTVGTQLMHVLKVNRKLNDRQAKQEALHMIEVVKLPDAEDIYNKYPHQLSGGQRQRIIIALALACGAEFLIADEPTRNLDVTIQASILQLLKELQKEFQITVLFIANNLSLVSVFCDEIGILYNGKIIEKGPVRELLDNPQDEYTKLLISSVKTKNDKSSGELADEILLEIKNLKKYFPVSTGFFKTKKRFVKAVDGVDLTIKKGEVLGIVGESGCGKSTLVNTILNLHSPTSGEVDYQGRNIYELNDADTLKIRKKIQIVFQDPFWSLNPRWLVKDIVSEPLAVHENLSASETLKRVNELLDMVGLDESAAFKYPHEFSGGQRQRIAIARSLAVNPELVVLDEPTSSIDIFSQTQILELLQELKEKFELTNILISHDLGVVNKMSDNIAVMYLGKIVEYGKADGVFSHPQHPYTKALFNSIPSLAINSVEELETIEGNVPSAINPPEGCRFHTRCPFVTDRCKTEEPETVELDKDHMVSCWLYGENHG
ncbi:MAG TPA: ABC transporter ATP-binding protein [Clostridiaceae bacterium]|nr:ABC transporter ATP-binding protein [Clostridiaceae bacterium]